VSSTHQPRSFTLTVPHHLGTTHHVILIACSALLECIECVKWCVSLCRSIDEIQHDLMNAIKMKRAAKKAPLGASSESTTYPGISSANAADIHDDASSALCNAMGDLGIDPEVTLHDRSATHPSVICDLCPVDLLEVNISRGDTSLLMASEGPSW